MDKKEYLRLKKKLPQELQDLLSSTEMLENLENVCRKNDILQYLSEINNYVGRVLLGLLPINEFEEKLMAGLNLEKARAKKITREINRFVFYPVKSLLEDLYNMEIAPIAKMTSKLPVSKKEKVKESKKSTKSDTYRESIEL